MKNLLITICLCTSSFTISAQSHLMFKIGGNFDYLEFRQDDKSIDKLPPAKFIGGHFGMSMDIPLYEDIWSFSPDIQLVAKTSIGDDSEVILADVQVPLTFSCYILPDFGVDLGPQIAYRVVDLTKINGNFESNLVGLEKLDFGIAGGVRFRLNDNLMLVGRYFYGLRDLNTILQNQKTFNRSGQISFLYSGGGRGY